MDVPRGTVECRALGRALLARRRALVLEHGVVGLLLRACALVLIARRRPAHELACGVGRGVAPSARLASRSRATAIAQVTANAFSYF